MVLVYNSALWVLSCMSFFLIWVMPISTFRSPLNPIFSSVFERFCGFKSSVGKLSLVVVEFKAFYYLFVELYIHIYIYIYKFLWVVLKFSFFSGF